MSPNSFVTTTTNQYLAPSWQDNVLRDNFFFGLALKKTRPFAGSQVLQPKLHGLIKSTLIYGETPNCAFA